MVAPNYTAKMGGVRNWHRSRHEVQYGYYDTTYSYADTSFALAIINNKTVEVFGVSLVYDTSTSNSGLYVFSYTTAATSTLSSKLARYYPLANSISCSEHTYLGSFGYADDLIYTY